MKEKLKSFFTGYWGYLAVSSACELSLFDSLKEPKTVQQLAEEFSLDKKTLTHLLEAIVNLEFLVKEGDLYKLNGLSELLTETHQESLKYACLNWSKEHLRAWQELSYSIKTGKNAFEKVYKVPFFDYLNKNPQELDNYHKAMYQYAKDDYKNLPNIIDFSVHNSIIDVGGGYGALINNIQSKYPTLKCILFDLEKVIDKVTITNVQKIKGNFFDTIPIKTDAIILSRILHDWNDEKAMQILKNCYEALTNNGTLYIIENCTDKTSINLSLLSLNMTVMCESYERTTKEYCSLVEESKFKYSHKIKLNNLQTILIFKK
jgi:caffeic acid 3-O-methyltransferase